MTSSKRAVRSAVVKALQETPDLTSFEIAALFDADPDYVRERCRVFMNDGYLVRGTPRWNGNRAPLSTWRAADPQPTPKRRPLETYKGPPRKNAGKPAAKPTYPGQIVIERPAPMRDRGVVFEALAQMPDLQAAWMGRGA